MKNNKLNKTEAVELITNTKGKFFTVTFTKKDGVERTINGNVKSNSVSKLGYINIYSLKDKNYRNVNSQTISRLSINGVNYKVK
jgi:hypothetical protein